VPTKELKVLTLNTHFLEGTHQSLSARSLFTVAECSTWKKEAKTPTSQSCASLTKLTFHWIEPPEISYYPLRRHPAPEQYKKEQEKLHSKPYPRTQIMPKFCPSPTSNLVKPEKVSHPFLIFFHKPTPKAPTGSREHHPPHKLPNLDSTTTLHQASLSIPSRYNHLPNKAWLNFNKFWKPSPPSEIGVQTYAVILISYLFFLMPSI
jgi:hypothetical protein